MREVIDRMLSVAVIRGDVPGLAAAVENVLELVDDPCRLVNAGQVQDAIELGLSGSPSITARMSEPVE